MVIWSTYKLVNEHMQGGNAKVSINKPSWMSEDDVEGKDSWFNQ